MVQYVRRQNWLTKFSCAARGMRLGAAGQYVHLIATALVIAGGLWRQLPPPAWAILCLCISSVWAAELLNTAIEKLARVITDQEQPGIRDALDTAAGAVLLASLMAAGAGVWVFTCPW